MPAAATAAAGEEDVVGLLGAHLGGSQRPAAPTIASETFDFPEPSGPYDRDPGREGHLDGVGVRFKRRSLKLGRCMRGVKLAVAP